MLFFPILSQTFPPRQLLIGVFLAASVSAAAWMAGSLSISGALAAAAIGSLIFGLGGLPWALLLLVFFISSSALSRAFFWRKNTLSEKFSKGSRRDWGQVLANGGLGAGLVIVQAFLPGETWPWVAFAGGMAAVNADTWATEVGVLSPVPPRLVTTGRSVERGESGGVTLLGNLAAIGGGALVGVVAAALSPGMMPLALAAILALAGAGGSLLDSFLGATVQAIYHCPGCQKETERHPYHTCGAQTSRLRGWRWLNNDLVNFISSLFGAGTAGVLFCLLL